MSAPLSMVDRLEQASPLHRALLVWYPLVGGIGAWTVHLMALASAARWAEDTHHMWLLHLLTAVCAAATVLAMWLAHRLAAAAGRASDEALEDPGQLLFLGHLGLLVGAINLALILLEGLYVVVIPPR
jgi:cytochrome bd-type quinol oxidase subunit 2